MTDTDTDILGTLALVEATGLSLRQINYWVRTHRLRATGWDGERNPGVGHGMPRHFPAAEVHVAQTASRLLSAGFHLDPALTIARAFQIGTTVQLPAGFWLADLTKEQVGDA